MLNLTSLQRLIDSLIPPLLSHLWDSTLFLLFMLAILFVGRKWLTAGARFSIVLAGLAKFLVPSRWLVGLLGLDRLWSRPAALELPLQVLTGPVALPGIEAAEPDRWPALAAAVWVVLAVTLALRYTILRRRAVALAVRTSTPPSAREVEALQRARRHLGIRRSIDLARSPLPETPAVLRTLRPLIVLPMNGCDHLSDEELELLLRHECAHVARYDNLIARVESLICALFWFHPLIWIAQRITVVERERACDEAAAGSADEREHYLAALTKYCHAAIAPRLPGVSCMATALLKERIEHVKNYSQLKERAFSPRRVAVAAGGFLALFIVMSGVVGSTPAFAGKPDGDDGPYSIRIEVVRGEETIAMKLSVSDNATAEVLATPTLMFRPSEGGSARAEGPDGEVLVEALPEAQGKIPVEVTISKNGTVVQRRTLQVVPGKREPPPQFSGEPINISLKDAKLEDVIRTFGQLTGLEMRLDPDVTGTVTVTWENVPWDQAFDSLLKDQGLTYRIEGSTMHISRK